MPNHDSGRDNDCGDPKNPDLDPRNHGPDELEERGIESDPAESAAPRRRRRHSRRTVPAADAVRRQLTPEQRLVILDTWRRSKLPAKDFGALVGVAAGTLYSWKRRFDVDGPAGLQDKARGPKGGSRLPDATRRAILMLKESHPEWGQDRIHAVLLRSEGFAASPGAIGRVLAEEGYVVESAPTRPHPDKVRRFERARPNQMWQTDLFSFVLKRENRRVHMVAYMDDHSRFVVGHGIFASASGAMVREVLESAIANFGAPEEVLTDNGAQYHTWRGRSAFRKLLDRRGIRQIVARPRHPQTLGKVERFWGTLWRECVEQAIFAGLDDARRRIALFVDHYNFQRPHSGIDGMVPADRFFSAAAEVRAALEQQVAANALELARNGVPRKSFYLTGKMGQESVSLHGEDGRVILTRSDGAQEEVDLAAPGRRDDAAEQSLPDAVSLDPLSGGADAEPPTAPGTSPLDGILGELRDALVDDGGESAAPCDPPTSDEPNASEDVPRDEPEGAP